MTTSKRILVTPALPYANGAIHIGHLVEHVQVSTYVNALRMAGHEVLCVCGADSHGTAIEFSAMEKNVTPAEFAASMQEKHAATFARYLCNYDGGYGSTHTPENEKHAARIYGALKAQGHTIKKDVDQLYDPKAGRFLADRFVKGTCPICKTPDQYGDVCENCSSTYNATELIDPKSRFSDATPVMKSSLHVFVKLGDFAPQLQKHLARPGSLHESMQHSLAGWFKDGLKDWDVSRPGPYFGFPIPGETNDFFYVWLDAPIGYIALTDRATGGAWERWWRDPSVEIHHFIGKDILYFHTLFWPAMLLAVGDTLPTSVHVHGMLTVDGVKMAKSRGTFINADDFAEVAPPEALRYYFAAKLGDSPSDIDLSLEDFTNRVNADLVNNVVNLISRTVPQLHKVAEGKPGALDPDASWLAEARASLSKVPAKYQALDFAGAVRTVVEVASVANKYLQDTAPWTLPPERARVVLTTAIWVGKACLAMLKPILPNVVATLEKTLKVPAFTFENALDPLAVDVAIEPYARLFERLDPKRVQSVVKPLEGAVAQPAKGAATATAKAKSKAKVDDTVLGAEI
ncbi:MAG TPA: methionine--tRNA ligase, partial [Myxococcota bacterium]